jgi:hypothetical protein
MTRRGITTHWDLVLFDHWDGSEITQRKDMLAIKKKIAAASGACMKQSC